MGGELCSLPTFDVSVQHFLSMAVSQALQKLLHVALDLRDCELLARVSQPREVVIAKLHHHVDGAFALVVVRPFRGDNFLEPHNVLVIQYFEDLDLADRGDREL